MRPDTSLPFPQLPASNVSPQFRNHRRNSAMAPAWLLQGGSIASANNIVTPIANTISNLILSGPGINQKV
jgi:hypothetical protein